MEFVGDCIEEAATFGKEVSLFLAKLTISCKFAVQITLNHRMQHAVFALLLLFTLSYNDDLGPVERLLGFPSPASSV